MYRLIYSRRRDSFTNGLILLRKISEAANRLGRWDSPAFQFVVLENDKGHN